VGIGLFARIALRTQTILAGTIRCAIIARAVIAVRLFASFTRHTS
jgi:hypothetical protein